MGPMLKAIVDKGIKLTPMMEQYIGIKSEQADTLLFFRMGDFYELFFDDAVLASKLLNITLTHRGKLGDINIPMAGIPYHSVATYLDRLNIHGIKVAICEQIEDPKQAKGIVRRQVTQIVSPGMPYDLEKTAANENRYMASFVFSEKAKVFYVTLLDFTTGDFIGAVCADEEALLEKVKLYAPKEIILYKGQLNELPLFQKYLSEREVLKTYLDKDYFSIVNGSPYLKKFIPAYERDEVLKNHQEVLRAVAGLAFYISSTQSLSELYHIRPFRMESDEKVLRVTLPTLKGLEIFPKGKDDYRDSLLGFMDKTKTAMGSREIRKKFLRPSRNQEILKTEYSLVHILKERGELLLRIREELASIRDIERIMAKVTTKKVVAQDLLNLSLSIEAYHRLMNLLQSIPCQILALIKEKDLNRLLKLAQKLKKTLNDEIGASLEKGNLIKEGANSERDQLALISQNTEDELLKMESKYRTKTGISNLKVKYNNIAGYFVEVSKSHLSKVPKFFERRQTLVNAERFVTKELEEFEKEVLTAKERLERLERKIFEELVENVTIEAQVFLDLAHAIGALDVYQSFAWIALQEDFVKPEIVSHKQIKIHQGWHPLIKSVIKDQFVCHDVFLGENEYFGLITGPNMAGKTTVMREVAIIQFLAQVGSFVPAQSAQLHLCDALFSRLGASDDIMRGQSTFMVEMAEMAEILRHATANSLIIVDEVGRGTSTYDGLSIAWSLVEYLVQDLKALTLFSTHYHELIDVVYHQKGAKNYSVATSVHGGDVQFLYRLEEKGAEESYGIYVAKLAGLPFNVLKRSEEILLDLENKQQKTVNVVPYQNNKLELDLASLDILNMTPLQAMEKLYQLKKSANNLRSN